MKDSYNQELMDGDWITYPSYPPYEGCDINTNLGRVEYAGRVVIVDTLTGPLVSRRYNEIKKLSEAEAMLWILENR